MKPASFWTTVLIMGLVYMVAFFIAPFIFVLFIGIFGGSDVSAAAFSGMAEIDFYTFWSIFCVIVGIICGLIAGAALRKDQIEIPVSDAAEFRSEMGKALELRQYKLVDEEKPGILEYKTKGALIPHVLADLTVSPASVVGPRNIINWLRKYFKAKSYLQ